MEGAGNNKYLESGVVRLSDCTERSQGRSRLLKHHPVVPAVSQPAWQTERLGPKNLPTYWPQSPTLGLVGGGYKSALDHACDIWS